MFAVTREHLEVEFFWEVFLSRLINLTETYQPCRSTVLEQRFGPNCLVARPMTVAMQWWLTPQGTSMPRVTPEGHYQEPLHWDRMMAFS